MKKRRFGYKVMAICIASMGLIHSGCKKIDVLNQQKYSGGQIARPACIWVSDFVVTASDLPKGSHLADLHEGDADAQSTDHVAMGKHLGSLIATRMVDDLRAMGMHAERSSDKGMPKVNDLVIRGTLFSFDEGDAKKRVLIGMGKGEAELHVAVEGYQMTSKGLRRLGSGEASTHDSKSPGAAMGAVMLVATKNPLGMIVSTGMKIHGEHSGSTTIEGCAQQTSDTITGQLRVRFQEQGWVPEESAVDDD